MRKNITFLLVALLVLLFLISCKRKVPVSVYSGTGAVCHHYYMEEPPQGSGVTIYSFEPLVIGATISWPAGSYEGIVLWESPNEQLTGFTVEIEEGSEVGVAGSGSCCCEVDATNYTLVYDYKTDFTIETTGMFSTPHYYVVFREEGIDYYYE